jgi:hypothetical protein
MPTGFCPFLRNTMGSSSSHIDPQQCCSYHPTRRSFFVYGEWVHEEEVADQLEATRAMFHQVALSCNFDREEDWFLLGVVSTVRKALFSICSNHSCRKTNSCVGLASLTISHLTTLAATLEAVISAKWNKSRTSQVCPSLSNATRSQSLCTGSP